MFPECSQSVFRGPGSLFLGMLAATSCRSSQRVSGVSVACFPSDDREGLLKTLNIVLRVPGESHVRFRNPKIIS